MARICRYAFCGLSQDLSVLNIRLAVKTKVRDVQVNQQNLVITDHNSAEAISALEKYHARGYHLRNHQQPRRPPWSERRRARVTHTELPDEPFSFVISLPVRSTGRRDQMHRPQGIRWRSQDIRWRPHQMPPSQHQMLRRRNQMAPSLMAPLAI